MLAMPEEMRLEQLLT